MLAAGFLDRVRHDLRSSFRALARRPAFTLAAVLTLAVGIGATTAIFSVVNAVLLKPLAYPNAERLVSLKHTANVAGLDSNELMMAATMYYSYLDENRTFELLGLWQDGGQTITGIGDPEQARALWVTYGTLQAFGVEPMLGRWFSEADDTPGTDGPLPVILSHAYWQRRFGGDRAVLGRTFNVESNPAEVIGVMPEGFRFLNMIPQAEVIIPMRLDRSRLVLTNFCYRGVAKLKPGVTLEEANADLARILPVWLESWPPAPTGLRRETIAGWHIVPALRSLKEDLVGGVASMLWVLMGTIGGVLLIACANVANLMLVRAEARRQELSVRAALGAGPGRIAKELLVESLVLGAMGGALGLVLARAGLELLVAVGPASLPRLAEISVDPAGLAFAILVSLVSSLLFGTIPALKYATAADARGSFAARGASVSRERQRARSVLIVVQVALALVLVVSSGLMLRTFEALRAVDAGFTEPESIQTARIWLAGALPGETPERYLQIQRQMRDEIAALPGVTSAAFTASVPMEGRVTESPIYVEGAPYSAADTPAIRRFKFISPGYFETLGTRLLAGRDFNWSDIEALRPVTVISESLARELFGGEAEALGKRIRETPPDADGHWREIVGVVQDVHEDALDQSPPTMAYWPALMEKFWGNAKFGLPGTVFVVRSDRAGTESLINEIRQTVWSVNANLPVFLIRTMQDLYADSLARTSFTLVMLAIAGAMALGLGIIGIYGVIAYVVSRRAREIGIRLALGARPAALERMFVRHALVLAAIGVAIGLAAAVALTRLMSSLLFGVGSLDPLTYVGALLVILAAAALASYVPARRAAMIDPVETLRAE
jgi:predicted permease